MSRLQRGEGVGAKRSQRMGQKEGISGKSVLAGHPDGNVDGFSLCMIV